MRILDEEGWYPVIPYVKAFNNVFGLYADSPGILDNYTDGLQLPKIHIENPADPKNAAHKAHLPSP